MMRASWSTRSILLCLVSLLSADVLAVTAVLGIDLGTEYIKAALVKPGIPLEIVLTKDSRRKEASAVAFKPSPNGPKAGSYPERAYGSDAMALAPRFPGDVYPNLKSLLGLPADSTQVKEYVARHPALHLETHKLRGTAAFKSAAAFTQEEDAWMVEELLAMELQSIRDNAEALAGPGSLVRNAVLTVPPFYTVEEKRAIQLAASLAGLKVSSLISDGLAVGLNYATSRQFPNMADGAKPEYHMVFDMGAGSTKATLMQFNSRTRKDFGRNVTFQEVHVLGTGWDRTLGGDVLNYLIVDDMVTQFVDSPKAKSASVSAANVKSHGRAIAKMTKDAERLRHVLSANQYTQTSFEGLYDDVDFKYKLARADFEAMAAAHAGRVGGIVQAALDAAGLKIADLDSVILHGGASRTPFVQRELETVLKGSDKIRTNVNSDEAAVFGAGFRAAQISPSFRVKEIAVADVAAYPAGMKWKNDEGKPKSQRLWTQTSHLGAPAKQVTLPNKDDFAVTFYQLTPVPGDDATQGSIEAETRILTTKNLTATVTELVEKYKCEKAEIHLKVGVRLNGKNGEVDVTNATVECESEEHGKDGFVDGVKNLFGFGKKEQQPLQGDADSSTDAEPATDPEDSPKESPTPSSSTTTSVTASASEAATDKASKKTKQLITIPIDFILEKAGNPTLPKADFMSLKNRIKAFEASDKARRLREETLNQLEAFAYKVRDLVEGDVFVAASTTEERAGLVQKSSETSDWLYGDGAEASRDELKKRLKVLQDIVAPIQNRMEENSKRPDLVKGLRESLEKSKEFAESIKKKIAEYEAFQTAKVASATSESTESTSPDPVSPDAPSRDSDGSEDGDLSATAPEDPVTTDPGPIPPLYTLDDLKVSEDLYVSTLAWLEEKAGEQAKLAPSDNPVLLVKDLQAKRDKLDKMGVELALKGVRNFEGKEKQPKTGKGRVTKPKGGDPDFSTIKLGKDGKMPSQEELEKLLRQFTDANKEKKGADKASGKEMPSPEALEEMIKQFSSGDKEPEEEEEAGKEPLAEETKEGGSKEHVKEGQAGADKKVEDAKPKHEEL